MTPTEPTATNRLSKRRSYRRLMWGFVGGGVVLGLGLRLLDYPLLGEAVYLLGFLGFLAVWRGTSLTLFDERDRSLERRASAVTLTLFAFVLILGASAVRVLPEVGASAVPPEFAGVMYGLAAVYVTFGAVYLWLRYRP